MKTRCAPTRRGLTLLELVVVLGILALLAGLALRTSSGLFDQSRYDSNMKQLAAISDAVIGDAGFVSDIGRLPQAQGTAPAGQLAEMWRQGTLTAFSIQTPPGDPEARLGAGWRGPYLALGAGQRDLRDAYGNPFDLLQADATPAGDGDPVALVRSLGADGPPADAGGAGPTGYDADETVVFHAGPEAVAAGLAEQSANHWQAPVAVTIHREKTGEPPAIAEGNRVLVRVYGPDGNGQLRTIASATLPVTGGILTHTFPSLPYGPKIVRAYQADTSSLPSGDDAPFTVPPPWRSSPASIAVNRRMAADPAPLILRPF